MSLSTYPVPDKLDKESSLPKEKFSEELDSLEDFMINQWTCWNMANASEDT